MNDNVVPLRQGNSPPTAVDPWVVELLRKLLTQAEAGEINGIAVAFMSANQAGVTDVFGTAAGGEGANQNVQAMLGQIEGLKLRWYETRVR